MGQENSFIVPPQSAKYSLSLVKPNRPGSGRSRMPYRDLHLADKRKSYHSANIECTQLWK
jgi:hypothetical protein